VLNPKMDRPDVWANIGDIRRAEMDAARAILGIEQAWLGFVDSGLPEGDPLPPLPEGCFALEDVEVAAAPLVRLMRQFRPHVVTTYDEEGGYPHPDHIMTHKVTVAAFEAAGDPERHPELGEPWQPLKLYYDVGFSRAKIMALHEAMLAAGLESPYGDWMKRWEDRADKGERITTRVDCAEYFPVRDDALRAHATQIDPDGFWFQVPMDLQQRAWPTEDFQLARSLVDSPLPESDLFAGVRETCRAR
jgi:mycothiol S-conjugate amidase